MANYYNIGARYEIIGRVTERTSVIAYIIKDNHSGGNIYPMEKSMVEQLALNKQIYNCTGQIYGNIINLKGINCKLNQLPRYDRLGNKVIDENKGKRKVTADLELVGKVQKGRVITDYILISLTNPDKPFKLPRDMVLKLAQEGRVVNAKSQKNGEEIMLRGVEGFNLAQLKTYN